MLPYAMMDRGASSRARRIDLEVERIVAESELRAVRADSARDIPGASAGTVVDARRRYASLRLEVLVAWTEDTVRERRDALSLVAERVRERESASGDEDDKAEETRLSTDIEAARSDLREALAAAGLAGDGTDDATEARMLASLPTPMEIERRCSWWRAGPGAAYRPDLSVTVTSCRAGNNSTNTLDKYAEAVRPVDVG